MTTARHAVRMSEEAWRAIKVAAASEGITMGEWIEKTLDEHRVRMSVRRLVAGHGDALARLGDQ